MDKIDAANLTVEEVCASMESELWRALTGHPYSCDECGAVVYADGEDGASSLVCPVCGESESFTEQKIEDAPLDYVLTYELCPALWDRGYFDIKVFNYHWSDLTEGMLLFHPFDREFSFRSDVDGSSKRIPATNIELCNLLFDGAIEKMEEILRLAKAEFRESNAQ